MHSFDKFLAICVISVASLAGAVFVDWSAFLFGIAGFVVVGLQGGDTSDE